MRYTPKKPTIYFKSNLRQGYKIELTDQNYSLEEHIKDEYLSLYGRIHLGLYICGVLNSQEHYLLQLYYASRDYANGNIFYRELDQQRNAVYEHCKYSNTREAYLYASHGDLKEVIYHTSEALRELHGDKYNEAAFKDYVFTRLKNIFMGAK